MFRNKYIRKEFKYKKEYKIKKILIILFAIINGLFMLYSGLINQIKTINIRFR